MTARPVHLLLLVALALLAPAGASARVLHPETARVARAEGRPFIQGASASASAASARRSIFPVVTSLSPRHVAIGQRLTIRGRNFRPGMRRNTVVFRRGGGRFVFVKADRSSTRWIQVVIPAKLRGYLANRAGTPVATRFSIRILAKRFGASFTRPSRSPVVEPRVGGTAPTIGCDRTKLVAGEDPDHDGLSNSLESRLRTDPCLADTDGDSVTDGYEYESALDYNSRALPFPGKRPYPNPLDPSDLNIDHDGDGLTLADEFTAWSVKGGRFPLVFSSAGTQTSGGYQPAPTGAQAYLDYNGDGQITDDEKDYDGDQLANWVERYGPMQPQWWRDVYDTEIPYGLSSYKGTDWLDPDTDGDGLLDGPDDVDHDGRSNLFESLPREPVQSGGPASNQWTQPFNPCLPQWQRPSPSLPDGSPTCSQHHPAKGSWEPWGNDGILPAAEDPYTVYDPFPWPEVKGWAGYD